MTTQKSVGDAISVAVTVKHKGAGEVVTVNWVLLPIDNLAALVNVYTEDYTILQSPTDGQDFEELDLGVFTGTYPVFDYQGEEVVGSGIEVVGSDGVVRTNRIDARVYSLAPAPPPDIPVSEFKDLSAIFS